MKTAGDLRAEAQCFRDIAKRVTDVPILEALDTLIGELESRARYRTALSWQSANRAQG